MTRIAYFDPIGGASGDMIVAALLDAGVSFQALSGELSKLNLHEFELSAEKVAPRHMSSTRFQVHVRSHHHEHHSHDEQHGRTLGDIEEIIASSALAEGVKENSLRVFRALAEAEASVHATTVDQIHFHEVGAVDSIVDIVGACAALHLLGVDKVFVGQLPLSHGVVKCAHGEWPIPGPAALALLKGFRWRNTDIEGELVTPTAAAIFAALGADSKNMPGLTPEAVGYGAGQNDYGIPNVLRVCIAESEEQPDAREVVVIETGLDDMNPELLDHTMSCLFASGALDVWFTPIQMKKNRPAVQLSALCSPEHVQALCEIILRETSTLGVRLRRMERICLEREVVTVLTNSGPVRVKKGFLTDGSAKAAPEYDDVCALARETGRPAREIYQEALIAALRAAE